MNERIKELYNQSLEEKYQYGGSGAKPGEMYSNYITVLNPQKFAESIVRECANVILNNDVEKQENYEVNSPFFSGWERGVIDSAVAIKEHFGVE